MIAFSCPTCSRTHKVNDSMGGQKAKCPCGQKVLIPRPPVAARTVLGKLETSEVPLLPQPQFQPKMAVVVANNNEAPAALPFNTNPFHSSDEIVGLEAYQVPVSPLRKYLPSSSFVLLLILSFLPWVQIQCAGPSGSMKVTQSGVQAIYGSCSYPPLLERKIQEEKKVLKDNPYMGPLCYCQPAVVIYLLAIIFGLITILMYKPSSNRLRIVAAWITLAWIALIAASIIGFPLEHQLIANDKLQKAERFHRGGYHSEMDEAGDTLASAMIESSHTNWFWLVFFLTPLAIVPELVASSKTTAHLTKLWRNMSP